MKKLLLVPALFLLLFVFQRPHIANAINLFSYCSTPPTGCTLGGTPCKMGYDCLNSFVPQNINDCASGGGCLESTTCGNSLSSYICYRPRTGLSGDSNPTAGCNSTEINTAIGCIPVGEQSDFITFILRWAIGVGGGIAFFLIIMASFMIMTSAGNPERQKAGQELLTSAIAGLIMLIFSVFILKVIGVDILKLPGIM